MLQHIDWRYDGPYTWPEIDELKCQLRQIQKPRTWPDEYLMEPVRIDHLANLLKYIHQSQSVIDIYIYLGRILQTWYIVRLKENTRLMLEVFPAFCSTAVFELMAKPHPVNEDFCLIAVDGTHTLTGMLADWVVFANGTGSTSVIVEEGGIVPVQFNIDYLLSYGVCIKRVGGVGGFIDHGVENAIFAEPKE